LLPASTDYLGLRGILLDSRFIEPGAGLRVRFRVWFPIPRSAVDLGKGIDHEVLQRSGESCSDQFVAVAVDGDEWAFGLEGGV
jgi:hypothetical protein